MTITDVAELDDVDMEELECLGTAHDTRKITKMTGAEKLRALQTLSLRSNKIVVVEGIGHLQATLTYLELNDNLVKSLRGVETLTALEYVTLSSGAEPRGGDGEAAGVVLVLICEKVVLFVVAVAHI